MNKFVVSVNVGGGMAKEDAKIYKKFKKKNLIYLIQLLKTPGQTVRRNTYPGEWGVSNSLSGGFDKLGPELCEILDWLEPMPDEQKQYIEDFKRKQEAKHN